MYALIIIFFYGEGRVKIVKQLWCGKSKKGEYSLTSWRSSIILYGLSFVRYIVQRTQMWNSVYCSIDNMMIKCKWYVKAALNRWAYVRNYHVYDTETCMLLERVCAYMKYKHYPDQRDTVGLDMSICAFYEGNIENIWWILLTKTWNITSQSLCSRVM